MKKDEVKSRTMSTLGEEDSFLRLQVVHCLMTPLNVPPEDVRWVRRGWSGTQRRGTVSSDPSYRREMVCMDDIEGTW